MEKGLECLEAVAYGYTLTTSNFKTLLKEDGLVEDSVC